MCMPQLLIECAVFTGWWSNLLQFFTTWSFNQLISHVDSKTGSFLHMTML
jgi:hypothetical protein